MDKTSIRRRLQAAKGVKVTTESKEQQRRSFAYGNTHLENSRITRTTIDDAAERLSKPGNVAPD